MREVKKSTIDRNKPEIDICAMVNAANMCEARDGSAMKWYAMYPEKIRESARSATVTTLSHTGANTRAFVSDITHLSLYANLSVTGSSREIKFF